MDRDAGDRESISVRLCPSKQTVAIGFIFVLVVSSVVASVASAADNTSDFDDGFESDSAGTSPENWTVVNGNPVVVDTASYSGENSLELSNPDQMSEADEAIPSVHPLDTSSVGSVSAAMMQSSGSNYVTLRLYNDSNTPSDVFVRVRVNDAALVVNGNEEATVPSGTWVYVTIEDIEPASNTFDVSYNVDGGGSGTVTDVEFENPADGYSIVSASVPLETTGYVDDVSIDHIASGSDVSGEVVDLDGNPIENATVYANQSGSVVASAETNQIGQYNLRLKNGTYDLKAVKDGHRSDTTTVEVDGITSVTQDFQLASFNQSINLDTKRFIEHGQSADYRVIIQNNTGRYNVTGEATVTSGNESVVTVDTSALQLHATTDVSVNQRTPVTAEWTDSEGDIYTAQTNVTVSNATVENIDILPTWTKTSASLGDETLQLIIVATMIGAGAAILASSFAGLSAATGITVLGWFAGMASDGVLIVAFLMAIFIGLNLAGNINMQVARS